MTSSELLQTLNFTGLSAGRHFDFITTLCYFRTSSAVSRNQCVCGWSFVVVGVDSAVALDLFGAVIAALGSVGLG
jgi:hypothetical protein